MDAVQRENFIAVLRAACGNGEAPLSAPDWDALAETARLQSLTALFYTGAVRYAAFEAWDAGRRAALQRSAVSVVAAQAVRTQVFLEVYRALCGAGLRPIVLKGIVLRQMYGALGDYRPSGDEDLYLPGDAALRCKAVLEQRGWRMASPAAGMPEGGPPPEMSFDDADRLLHLEIHPTLFETDCEDLDRINRFFGGAAQRAVPLEIEGTRLWTLNETDHYLYLFLHLAKHFKYAGVGVRQILDLMYFERVHGARIDWPAVRKGRERIALLRMYGMLPKKRDQIKEVPP